MSNKKIPVLRFHPMDKYIPHKRWVAIVRLDMNGSWCDCYSIDRVNRKSVLKHNNSIVDRVPTYFNATLIARNHFAENYLPGKKDRYGRSQAQRNFQ